MLFGAEPVHTSTKSTHQWVRNRDTRRAAGTIPSGPSALPIDTANQLAVSAVSSIKKLVCNDESSVPVHFNVTVCPAYADRFTDRCT